MQFINFNSGIYKIVDQFNETLYVGQTKDFKARYNTHLTNLRTNHHECSLLQDYANMFGLNSLKFIVVEMAPPEFLLIKEKYWIMKLEPLCNKQGVVSTEIDRYNDEEKNFIKLVLSNKTKWINGIVRADELFKKVQEKNIDITKKKVGMIMRALGFTKKRDSKCKNATYYEDNGLDVPLK